MKRRRARADRQHQLGRRAAGLADRHPGLLQRQARRGRPDAPARARARPVRHHGEQRGPRPDPEQPGQRGAMGGLRRRPGSRRWSSAIAHAAAGHGAGDRQRGGVLRQRPRRMGSAGRCCRWMEGSKQGRGAALGPQGPPAQTPSNDSNARRLDLSNPPHCLLPQGRAIASDRGSDGTVSAGRIRHGRRRPTIHVFRPDVV